MSYSKRVLIFFAVLTLSAGALVAAFWLRTSPILERASEPQTLKGNIGDFFHNTFTQPAP
jgi:hypothetical protein